MKSQLGKERRLEQIFSHNGKAFVVPVDDLLICGPSFQLADYREKIPLLSDHRISAVLGFPGVFNQFYDDLKQKPWIINLTTSTIRSNHTFKRLSIPLKSAIAFGCTAVAVHVNVTDVEEGEMIRSLANVSCECQEYGIPLMAIIYARKRALDGVDDNYLLLKEKDNCQYTSIIAHACRIAVELGADIIKTNYTGSKDGFEKVVYAAGDVPIIIAGGSYVEEEKLLDDLRNALIAGASGLCFGRNFFYRKNIPEFIEKVSGIVYGTEIY